jgi:Ribonucleases G and E
LKNKYIITDYKNGILSALIEKDKIVTLNYSEADNILLGKIYIGRVKNIVKNISAAFIDIGNDTMCYFSLEENHKIFFTKKNGSKKKQLSNGDEILVQISKEGVKTKAPVVTSRISLTGKYSVLTAGKNIVGISSKIKDEKHRNKLKSLFKKYITEDYGFIVRTNAENASDEELELECEMLIDRWIKLYSESQCKTCYSCIKDTENVYMTDIRDLNKNIACEVITDSETIFSDIQNIEFNGEVRLYNDTLLPLRKLYSLDKVIDEALKTKVWMKSGGYLIIERTEALTVIDVNTGKYSGNKNIKDTILKINLEAAKEAAYQIRLRNISGIILIDFIDMANEEDKNAIMKELDYLFMKDKIKTNLVDMTKLNLVEITRRKVRKPFFEQLM